MKWKKIVMTLLLMSQTMMLSAHDTLVNFKKAIEKSKVNKVVDREGHGSKMINIKNIKGLLK